MPHKILTLAASNNAHSINRALVEHAAQVLKSEFLQDAEIDTLDINDFEMPIYRADREQNDGIPEAAQAFYDRITAADALMISFPEHNGTYSAAYKNLFDWASRIKMAIYQDKPAVFLAASPGGRGAAKVLEFAVTTAPFFGAKVVGSMSVGKFGEAFDKDTGMLSGSEHADALNAALSALAQTLQGQDRLAAA